MLIIALLLLTAYGSWAPAEASPTSNVGTSAAADVAKAQGEAVTIQFLTLDDPQELLALDQMAKAFAASDPKYANVTIQYQSVPFEQLFPKIETAVAAGAVIDLFLADGPDIKHYAYNEVIVPLDKYFTPGGAGGVDSADRLRKAPTKVPSTRLAIMESCSLMFYNKDMTDAAGRQAARGRSGLDDGGGRGRLAEDHRRQHR